MPNVTFMDSVLATGAGTTLLELLEQNGHSVPSSCRSGVCQSCLMRAVSGEPPAAARQGLKPTLVEQGYFLACRCEPTEDLVVELPNAGDVRFNTEITGMHRLSESVIELELRAPGKFVYRAGQYLTLINERGTARSYSLASVPGLDGILSLHIGLVPNGLMSGWLSDGAQVGEAVHIQGPAGNCFYAGAALEQPLLLAGTGTGLAPLYGIARDALQLGHSGPVHLFHGSVRRPGLYLHETLKALATVHENFHYHACLLDGEGAEDAHIGALDTNLMETLGNLKGYRAYLCGAPDFVKLMQRKVFLAGVSLQEIYADSFLPAVKAQ